MYIIFTSAKFMVVKNMMVFSKEYYRSKAVRGGQNKKDDNGGN
mgnify:CR=1 FL=1